MSAFGGTWKNNIHNNELTTIENYQAKNDAAVSFHYTYVSLAFLSFPFVCILDLFRLFDHESHLNYVQPRLNEAPWYKQGKAGVDVDCRGTACCFDFHTYQFLWKYVPKMKSQLTQSPTSKPTSKSSPCHHARHSLSFAPVVSLTISEATNSWQEMYTMICMSRAGSFPYQSSMVLTRIAKARLVSDDDSSCHRDSRQRGGKENEKEVEITTES